MSIKNLITLILLALFSVGICSAQTATYYVATNGSDSNPGTLAAPFRTLAHAQSVMNSSTIKTTTIRGGTYTLTGDIAPSSAETWVPFQNETPIIDGAGLYAIKGNASNLTIEGLTFQNITPTTGLNFGGDNVTLRWNTFTNCNRYCITAILTNSLVDSNTVNGQNTGGVTGTAATYTAIQLWPGTTTTRVSHNLIQNTQGGAIAAQDAGLTIDRNSIKNVLQVVTDWGAIYVNHSSSAGITISNNYIDGNGGTGFVGNATKSIYLDDLVSHGTVTGNICRKCGTYGLQIHGGTNNTFSNNIFDLSTNDHELGLYQFAPSLNTGMVGNVFTKNIIYSACSFPNPLWGIQLETGDVLPADSDNLYYSGCSASIPNTVIVDSSPVYANPQFTDPANGNYAMPSTSPAFTQIGFTTLPTDQGPLPNPFVTGGGGSAPSISSFTANPSTITAGGTSSLAWSVSGATSISINQGVGVVTGSAVNVSPAGTTIYTLTATNSVGPSSAQTTVTVNAPVSLRTTGPENGLQFGRPSTAQLAAGLGVCKFGDYVAGLGSAFDGNCLNPPLMKSLDFLWPTWTIAGTAAPNSGQFLPESVVSPYWVYMGGGQIATNPGSNLYFGTNVASVGLQAALFDPTTGWFAASYLPNHGPNHLNGVPVDAAHPTTVTLDGFSSDYSFYVTSSGQHLPWDAPYPQTRAAWYDGWNAFFKYAVDHLPTIRLAPHIGSMEDSSLPTFQHIHQYTPIMEREPFCLSSLYTASNVCGGLSNINQIYAQINNLYWFANVAPKLFTNDPATRIVLLGTWLDNNDIHSALAYYSMMRGPNTNFDLLERTSAGQPPVDPSTWVPFANKMGAGISSPSSIIGSGASSVLRRSFQGAIAYFNLAAGTQVVSLPSGSFDWSGNLISSLTLTNGKGDVVFNTNTGVLGGPTILSFSASPTNVSSGGASTLTWSVTGATSLSIAGIGPVTGTSIVVNPTTTTTYNLTASNANGSITASTTVTVGGSGTCIGNHSYWRVYGTKASNGPTDTTNGLSSSELQFRSVSGGSNLATGGTALASSTISGFPASNAFDGNNSTFWSSALFAPVPQWLGYHFASPVNIVEFVWRDRGDGSTTWQDPTAGTLDYSDDGSIWTPAGPFSALYTDWLGTGSSNTFTVGSPCGSLPSITNFIATPSTISSGSSTLSWTTIGATSLSISPTVGTVTGLTSTSVSPSITTTYTLTAVNGNGSVTQTATVTVSSSGGLPSITSFTATPSTTTGGSSTLAWVTSGATSLSISPTVGIVTGLTSTSVSPTVTTTYTLTATNSAGSVTQTATVTVNVPPPPNIVSFIATPSVISTGNSSTLSWVVTGATSLSINQSIGTVTGTTSRVVSPTATTTYTLTASNANGTVTKDVTVFIGAPGSVGFVVNGATIRGATIPAH